MKGFPTMSFMKPPMNPNNKTYRLALTADTEEAQKSNGNELATFQNQTNQLYFYSDVTRESIYILNRQMSDLERGLRMMEVQFNMPVSPNIDLYISSEGGEVYSAFSTVDRILSSKIPVNTYVEGIAASAATLISVVGNRRYIRKNANMLVHQVSSGMWGNFSQFEDEMKNLELVMSMIKKIYLEHTKFKETDLNQLLKHDLCLSPKDCLKYGLVDEII